jgi:hypothetical protein
MNERIIRMVFGGPRASFVLHVPRSAEDPRASEQPTGPGISTLDL